MKDFRILVIVVLLALAAPFIVHHRGWAITGQFEHAHTIASNAQSSALGNPSPAPNQSHTQSSVPPVPAPPASDLPSGSSSLPLLSVIGFGILVGGVISALRTRSAHK